jgi:hypothetical protein
MANSGWLAFDAAIAYLTMQGLPDAEELLADAIDRRQVRCRGRVTRFSEGITWIDLAFNKDLRGEVSADDLRVWVKDLKAGNARRPNRLMTPSQRKAVLEKLTELRANDATNDEEETAIKDLLGFEPRREEIRGLRRETGLRKVGRKKNSAEK